MNYKIVSDSSSNILALDAPHFESVPMKIIAEKEYVDTESLDLAGMVEDLKNHKGKSGSSCPNMAEWMDAFGDADVVFGTTISRNLSGSYNAARQAAQQYMEKHPGKLALILDSMSAGPQQAMIIDKFRELIAQKLDIETIKEKILEYRNHTHILFCLESLTNLARNGRVSPAVAKISGVLGIRVVGDAKDGQITPVHKPRGAKKATMALVEMLKERGFFDGALLRVAHCFGEESALALRDAVLKEFPNTRFVLEKTTALCSFYAEAGGLMIGFEGGFNTHNQINEFN